MFETRGKWSKEKAHPAGGRAGTAANDAPRPERELIEFAPHPEKKKKKTFSKNSLANKKTVLKKQAALWCNIRERWSHGGCGRAPV